ncbi:MAG: SWIM zinc finger domain-containing protein [Halobacteriales archaeon]
MAYPIREEIRSLCTEQSFERGVNYWQQGRIQELTIDGDTIQAVVRGTHDYDISIDLKDDIIHTSCTCPYDYAGECKHIIAVLLAVNDQESDTDGDRAATDSTESLAETIDIEALVEQTSADELRSFLLDVIANDRDVRDRFVAFTGEETGKTVYDYKQEIDRRFEQATGRGGMIEYDTYIDFSQYHDLAETHRERGHVDAATDIYRALAETIRENMPRIDDSSGHYGRELERAVEAYAETITEQDLDHGEKQPYIDYLVEEFLTAEYSFVREDYDDALRILCTSQADLEYWLNRLDAHVPDVSLDPTTIAEQTAPRTPRDQGTTRAETTERTANAASQTGETDSDHERTDDILYASDFTDGPLTIEDFTSGTLDIEHLAVGPLELEYFVGDAFEELRIDAPTPVEEHTVDLDPPVSNASETGIASSLRTQNILSTYIHLLEELGEEDALSALYEDIYLESSQFCKQYAERLIEHGNEERAIDVVKAGIATFQRPSGLRWLAADLYRDRDPDKYRDTLKRLFLEHSEWDAYEELKAACDEYEWDSIYEDFEQYLAETDRRRLIAMYVREDELENAFAELEANRNLSWLRRYRDPVATVDPEAYFEVYRDRLVPFAAGETGRRHYRKIADHLEAMAGLVSEERFEEFVDFLRDKHSNRPAFLDELEKAGF